MKKSKRVPRKRRRLGELPDSLKFVELHVRVRHGEAVVLADFLKRLEHEWFALRNLKEAIEKAGIKPTGGRWV